MADETGWLIEKDDPPVYAILTEDYDEQPGLSDANKAVALCEAAGMPNILLIISGWTSPHGGVITEHMWQEFKADAARECVDHDWYKWSPADLKRGLSYANS